MERDPKFAKSRPISVRPGVRPDKSPEAIMSIIVDNFSSISIVILLWDGLICLISEGRILSKPVFNFVRRERRIL